jgi:site-specific DNA-methyltransferase (cytosine-N4-specific)
MNEQLSILPASLEEKKPFVKSLDWIRDYLISSDLNNRDCEYEDWEIKESSAELSYLTHGFFRYFGKFPPPVARRFIEELHDPARGPVIDPMCGSGTSLVEALLLKRAAIGLDVNPLSCLAAKVKTTPVAPSEVMLALDRYTRFYFKNVRSVAHQYIPQDPHLDHWFYPETQHSLARTRKFIEEKIENPDIRDVFRLVLASIIRRLSRASNSLGRMFLDQAIRPLDVHELFIKKGLQMLKGFEQLESFKPEVQVKQHDARLPFHEATTTNLVICHPPYFNVYRYSSIYKFEMLWLGLDYTETRKREVRDGFKIGRKELLQAYVNDMSEVFGNIERALVPGGWCVLMIGDTFLRGERINTTSHVLNRIAGDSLCFQLNKIIIRHPKYTEASYAAAQRRTAKNIGVKLPDHIVVMRKASA